MDPAGTPHRVVRARTGSPSELRPAPVEGVGGEPLLWVLDSQTSAAPDLEPSATPEREP